MKQIITEWESLAVQSDVELPRNDYGKGIDALVALLKKYNEEDWLRLISEVKSSKEVQEVRVLSEVFVILATDRRDYDLLTKVLSAKCPQELYVSQPIEYFLIKQDKRCFTVLLEVASKAEGENRAILQEILERSLPPDDLAGNVIGWWQANKERLTINDRYAHKLRNPMFESEFLFKKIHP